MPKASLHFDDLAETILAHPLSDAAGARKEREFRRTAHQHIWVLLNRLENRLIGRQINPERLFPEQMLPSANDISIDLLVLVVRYSHVDCLYLGRGQQLVIICSGQL